MLLSTSPDVTPSVMATEPMDLQRILRAVASSTAIETGQSISQIERTLRAGNSKFRHIALAR
jgi:hypothetical protein